MAILDSVNRQMGRGTLFHAAEGVAPPAQNHSQKDKSQKFIYGSRFSIAMSKNGTSSTRIIGTERWRMRSQFKSPSYTTKWRELAMVK